MSPAIRTRQPGVPGYEILGRIESGGQADIFRARALPRREGEPRLPEDMPAVCALKVVDARRSAVNPAAVPELLAEARCTQGFDHPGIVKVYEQGQLGAVGFYSMELVEGTDLCSRLEESGPLGEEESLVIALGLARALAHIHARRWVHRDVKPENVLVSGRDGRTERVVLIDFGLARSLERTEVFDGTTVGTTCYFSPEQCSDPNVTAASDIYSLGTTLFEMLTNTLPFGRDDENPSRIMRRIVDERPPHVRRYNRTVSRATDVLVRRMLDKRPKRRPAARDVAAALERCVEELRTRRLTGRRPARARRRWWWLAAGVAFATLAAVATLAR